MDFAIYVDILWRLSYRDTECCKRLTTEEIREAMTGCRREKSLRLDRPALRDLSSYGRLVRVSLGKCLQETAEEENFQVLRKNCCDAAEKIS